MGQTSCRNSLYLFWLQAKVCFCHLLSVVLPDFWCGYILSVLKASMLMLKFGHEDCVLRTRSCVLDLERGVLLFCYETKSFVWDGILVIYFLKDYLEAPVDKGLHASHVTWGSYGCSPESHTCACARGLTWHLTLQWSNCHFVCPDRV